MRASNVVQIPEPYEHWEQCQVFLWKAQNVARYTDLEWLNGSMSGVKLPPGLATKCKRAGLVKGKPDIDLPVPRGGFVGLKIELKRERTGKVEDEQRRWLAAMTRFGWYACVCHGHKAAIEIITQYIEGKLTREETPLS